MHLGYATCDEGTENGASCGYATCDEGTENGANCCSFFVQKTRMSSSNLPLGLMLLVFA